MKSKLTLLFSSFVLILVLGSCTLEKRVYSKGYHVHWNGPSFASNKEVKKEYSQPLNNVSPRKATITPIESKSNEEELLPNHYAPSIFNLRALEILSDVPPIVESKTYDSQSSNFSSLTANKGFPFKLLKSQKPLFMSFSQAENQEQSDDPLKESNNRKGGIGFLSLMAAWGLFFIALILAIGEGGVLVAVFGITGILFYAIAIVLGFVAVFDPADDLDLIFGILTLLASILPLFLLA